MKDCSPPLENLIFEQFLHVAEQPQAYIIFFNMNVDNDTRRILYEVYDAESIEAFKPFRYLYGRSGKNWIMLQ